MPTVPCDDPVLSRLVAFSVDISTTALQITEFPRTLAQLVPEFRMGDSDQGLGPLGGESIHLLDPALRVFADAAATSAITCFLPGTRPRSLRLRRVAHVPDLGGLSGGAAVPVTALRGAPRWGPLKAILAKLDPQPLSASLPPRRPGSAAR